MLYFKEMDSDICKHSIALKHMRYHITTKKEIFEGIHTYSMAFINAQPFYNWLSHLITSVVMWLIS